MPADDATTPEPARPERTDADHTRHREAQPEDADDVVARRDEIDLQRRTSHQVGDDAGINPRRQRRTHPGPDDSDDAAGDDGRAGRR